LWRIEWTYSQKNKHTTTHTTKHNNLYLYLFLSITQKKRQKKNTKQSTNGGCRRRGRRSANGGRVWRRWVRGRNFSKWFEGEIGSRGKRDGNRDKDILEQGFGRVREWGWVVSYL
jgi:hypothetical protein